MFLRRLSEAVTRQNWFVVIIEVLVVVVGIFIGLQVDDWNETRKARNDEQRFLTQLHADILRADELSSRVRDRRMDRLATVIDAGDVLFSRVERDMLTHEECVAISSSTYYNINVSGLPSYTELASTGRLGIVQDKELRTSLVALQQTEEAFATLVLVQTITATGDNLANKFPGLIQLESRFDQERGEVGSIHLCNLFEMRNNQAFLNLFSVNADRYDAYIRDGLAPWLEQFDRVHQQVDQALGISHQ